MNKLIFTLLTISLLACDSTQHETAEPSKSVSQIQEPTVNVVEKYPNDVIKITGQEKGGKRVGKWQSFYENGYKWSESTYKNGFREGPFTVYYRNGMLRYDGYYYNDERSGVWQFYDTLGVTIKKIDMDAVESVPDSLFKN